jgi:hypothetical protein
MDLGSRSKCTLRLEHESTRDLLPPMRLAPDRGEPLDLLAKHWWLWPCVEHVRHPWCLSPM